MAAELVTLRLDAFKSVRHATIDFGPLTLIAGRNGSGKSNVLDGLSVLNAMASGAPFRDALDGGRDGPIVRGGSSGCAPLGSDEFRIGCSASWEGRPLHLALIVQTDPTLQIRSESLWMPRTAGPKKGESQYLIHSDPYDPNSGDIAVRWDNGKRGVNPAVTMRGDQLLISQVATRVPATSQAGRHVHAAAEAMLQALASIFLLDPVPHQMREYVPEKDNVLRRSADNLSAVLHRVGSDERTSESLLTMTQSLSEAQVAGLSSVSSPLGDVMVTIEEMIGGARQPVPARLMSDGTLRFLAIAAALLDDSSAVDPNRVLVLEELENGLHPSQAALLVSRLKEAASQRGVRTVATTHSPAILNSLDGADHEFVVVTSRDSEGWSHATPLAEFPDYFEVASRSSIGEAAVQDRLRPGEPKPPRLLADIF